ncbi:MULTISPECIES: CBS domain-containing protein [Metallosphaera]|uniref:CBS domain-containing protein n=1 Tax=Metallosphaera TaxID=41980 RepID=UPI001F057842|nr:CBS domain-containing protein [Metallosphaera sedula]MCH1771234.1 CBS domain-containing protein [Metallosphaera sedula]MCP6729606.1 CBS domain-containing protein [Metallosphaera sedula]
MDPIVLIDVDRCVGCYMCQRACALAQCIEINEVTRFAEVVRPEDCTGCMACERACPYDCIVVLSDESQVPLRAKITLSRVRRYATKRLVMGDPRWSVRRGAEEMTKEGVGSLLLMNGTKIVTETDVLEAWIGGREEEPLINFSKDAITIEGKATVEEALRIMLEKCISHLPVIERGKLSGMISLRDVLRASSVTSPILDESILPINPREKIEKYAIQVPVVGRVTNRELYSILKERKLKATVVREGEKVGLISIRDLTKALAKGKSLDDLIDPRWINPVSSEEQISKAIAIMMEHNLRHLPVFQGAELKMLSVKEIAKHAVWIKVT